MKNDKHIYQLLNETKTNFGDYEETDVSHFEKQKILHAVKPVKRKKSPTILLAAVILFVFLGFQPPVQAAVRTLLDNFRFTLSEAFSNEENISETTIPINKVGYIGETEIKVVDLIYLNNQLIILTLVDLNEEPNDLHFMGFDNFSVILNGEIYTLNPSNSNVVDPENNIHAIIHTVRLKEDELLAKDVSINIQINDLVVFKVDSTTGVPPIEGAASFSIKTTAEELTRHLKKVDLNYRIETDSINYQVNTFYTHPITSGVEISSNNMNEEFQIIELRGVDEKGRNVFFYQGGQTQTENNWTGNFFFSPEHSDISAKELNEAKSIKLQFYTAGHPEGTGATFETYGEPFLIEINN